MSALLEIYRFVPPALLEGFDAASADMDELISYLAKARHIEQIETDIFARAISKVFAEE